MAENKVTRSQVLETVEATLDHEIAALTALKARSSEQIADAVELCLVTMGHVIVTGIGKSGHIGKKIAASMASLGTPTFFVHSTEVLHGDAGMITGREVVIALSNSGTTSEVVAVAQYAASQGCPVIAMTGKVESPLAQAASVVIDTGVEREADPLNLAPTSSTTAQLAAGDALACALVTARGFGRDDFLQRHPAGALGKMLAEKKALPGRKATDVTGAVCVLGSFMMDLIAYAPRLPKPGETLPGTKFVRAPGGKGFNQAIAAARAGAPTEMLGVVGADIFGEQFLDMLRAEGIESAGVETDGQFGTGVGLPVILEQDGNNAIIIIPQANNLADEAYVERHRASVERSQITLLQLELPVNGAVVAAKIAHTAGKMVVLNPAPCADIFAFSGLVDVATPNEGELASLAPGIAGTEPAARALSDQLGGCDIVVTLGADGAGVLAAGLWSTLKAPVVKVVDTVGAGDTLCGYLCAALARGDSLLDATAEAIRAASISVTLSGGSTSIPHRGELA